MQSKPFPFSMENIPRQTGFACLSLKFGSILSALIVILLSVFGLAKCFAAVQILPDRVTSDDVWVLITYAIVVAVTTVHVVTLVLSAVMLVGVLRDKAYMIKPWVIWTSLQVSVYLLLFVFFTTMNMINHFSDASLAVYIIDFLGLLIRFYMLMLVASLYKQLEEEKHEGERVKKLLNHDAWYSAV